VLGHGDKGWTIWPQRPSAAGRSGQMTVNRSTVVGSYPYGEVGWREAWEAFLRLEPGYRTKQRRERWKPVVGVSLFWVGAGVLAVAAILAHGISAWILLAVLVMYLLTFLVLALGESLPWNS
jgi:hypothetical protein